MQARPDRDERVRQVFDTMAVIFDKLKMTEVELHYEGSGDSGDIVLGVWRNEFTGERIVIGGGSHWSVSEDDYDKVVSDDMISVMRTTQQWVQGQGWTFQTGNMDVPISQAVAEFGSFFLDRAGHGGWENNEGAQGKMILTRSNCRIAHEWFEKISHEETCSIERPLTEVEQLVLNTQEGS